MAEYDPGTCMEKLYLSDPLQDPLMRRIVKAIGLPAASNGLDAGCGVGLQIPPLAEAVGPGGHVTGLDILPVFINEAGRHLGKWGIAEQVSLVVGDIYALPFEDHQFDWKLYQRITDPTSADFILDQPDYYGFYTYTLFQAKAPG